MGLMAKPGHIYPSALRAVRMNLSIALARRVESLVMPSLP